MLRFLGSVNTLAGAVATNGDGTARIDLDCGLAFEVDRVPHDLHGQSRAVVHLRTEDIGVAAAPTPVQRCGPAFVTLSTFLGAHERIVATLASQQIVIDRPANGRDHLPAGSPIYLDFNPARCRLGRSA